jgi:hypothetical protein
MSGGGILMGMKWCIMGSNGYGFAMMCIMDGYYGMDGTIVKGLCG